jgi:3-deoxy-manno-octulosonate cytidylyltransferase (CMP-KDO synthetase)
MSAIGVIPARYGSTRLPAKPLLKINGRPLLEWVIRGVQSSKKLDELVVATDHEEIEKLARNLGVRAVMTDPNIPSGSDRVWAAARESGHNIVLNIQGDEPLIKSSWVDKVVDALTADASLEVATLAHPFPVNELSNLGSVKVILNKNNDAIYFSRYPIPYSRETHEKYPGACLKHVGIYGYKADFLKKYCAQAPTALERGESLEQLRALWLGARIHVVEIQDMSVGVDTPDDVKTVEGILKG